MNRDDIIRVWRNTSPSTVLTEEGLRICEAIAAAEREACAKVCDAQEARSTEAQIKAKREADKAIYSAAAQTAHWNAAAIRARKEEK